MSLLHNVIFATHARSTHHKLALESLKHLNGGNSEQWNNLLLSEHAAYLEGAKAPDDDFKDFKNHVLHVKENFWGGAVASVEHWYGQLVDLLRGHKWKDACYAAGVLSHYYSDPQMPFHTGQTEAEGAVHRAAEWSVTKSYEILRSMIQDELGGYPLVNVPGSENWLAEMVRDGAVRANAHYDLLIDHYNLAVGAKNPPAGLDRVAQEAVAECLAYATIGFARILDRAFAEASVSPPEVTLTLKTVLATVNGPIRKVMNSLADAFDRKAVQTIYDEVQATGKAVESLPESERLVRQFHAAEVRKVSLLALNAEKARPAGQKFGKPKTEPVPEQTTKIIPFTVAKSPTVQPANVASLRKAETAVPPATTVAAVAPVPTPVPVPTPTPIQASAPIPMPAPAPVPDFVALTEMTPVIFSDAPTPEPTPEKSGAPVVVAQVPLSLPRADPAPSISRSAPSTSLLPAQGIERAPEIETVQKKEAPEENSPLPAVLPMPRSTAGPRTYLKMESPIVDAPSIGPKTAGRFQQIGFKTVAEFLNADAADTATRLNTRHISIDVVRDWQAQSLLMVKVAGIRGHDAQLIVAAKIVDAESLSHTDATTLLPAILDVADSAQGRSILRDSSPPDLEEVTGWIQAARRACTPQELKAS